MKALKYCLSDGLPGLAQLLRVSFSLYLLSIFLNSKKLIKDTEKTRLVTTVQDLADHQINSTLKLSSLRNRRKSSLTLGLDLRNCKMTTEHGGSERLCSC